MLSATLHIWLLINIAWHSIQLATSQYAPPIPCPNYFEYLRFDGQNIGKITLPNVALGTTKLDVRFSQRAQIQSSYFGRLSLFQNHQTTVSQIRNGLPVSYRVDFPLQNVLPKLTRISVNDVDICSASEYPRPSTTLTLQHVLHTSADLVNRIRRLNNDYDYFDNSLENANGYPTFRIPSNTDVVNTRPTVAHRFFQITDGTTLQNSFVPQVQRLKPTQGSNVKLPNPFLPQTPRPKFEEHTVPTIEYFTPSLPSSSSSSPESSSPPPPPPPSTTTIVSTTSTTTTPLSSENLNSKCGQEDSTITPFIHGGTTVSRGQLPWLTAIYRKQSADLRFICGGSLVSVRTVVTAAHCFQPHRLSAEQVVVYLGRHNLENYSESGVIIRDIQKLLIHPDYNSSSISDADIAILQMTMPVSFSQYIRPICLWDESDDSNRIVGQKGYVAGWGADENGNAVTAVPKMVDTNIVSEADCLRTLDVFKVLTTNRTLCAGNRDGTGPCMGDSGGGLMMIRNKRWVLRGIVSAGSTVHRQCNLNEYVIYCDLAKHLTWVQNNLLHS